VVVIGCFRRVLKTLQETLSKPLQISIPRRNLFDRKKKKDSFGRNRYLLRGLERNRCCRHPHPSSNRAANIGICGRKKIDGWSLNQEGLVNTLEEGAELEKEPFALLKNGEFECGTEWNRDSNNFENGLLSSAFSPSQRKAIRKGKSPSWFRAVACSHYMNLLSSASVGSPKL